MIRLHEQLFTVTLARAKEAGFEVDEEDESADDSEEDDDGSKD